MWDPHTKCILSGYLQGQPSIQPVTVQGGQDVSSLVVVRAGTKEMWRWDGG